jgi:hypothetical protein
VDHSFARGATALVPVFLVPCMYGPALWARGATALMLVLVLLVPCMCGVAWWCVTFLTAFWLEEKPQNSISLLLSLPRLSLLLPPLLPPLQSTFLGLQVH